MKPTLTTTSGLKIAKCYNSAVEYLSNIDNVLIITALIMIVMVGTHLRLPARDTIQNIDEIIPLEVQASMSARSNLDTNWSNVINELPYDFGKVHFNLSGYILYSYFFITSKDKSEDHLAELRNFNSVCYVLLIIIFAYICSRLKLDSVSTIAGLLVLTFSPGMVHDAQMARPEAFLALLAGLVILGAIVSEKSRLSGCILAGFALGTGIATKLIFAAFALPYLYVIMTKRFDFLQHVFLYVIAIIAGFIIAAPYAVINPLDYVDGLQALNSQYQGVHYPHSDFAGTPSFNTQFNYYILVYGVIFLSPVLMLTLANGVNSDCGRNIGLLISIALSFVILFIFLGVHPVFFERNLHPYFVVLALCSSIILATVRSGRWRVILTILLLAQPSYWTFQVYLVQKPEYFRDFNNNIENITKEIMIRPVEISIDSAMHPCGLIKQYDYNDKPALDQRQKYLNQSFSVLQEHISKFNLLPTSTLHTYLDANTYLLYKKCDWPFETVRYEQKAALIDDNNYVTSASIIADQTSWIGSDYYKSELTGMLVVGSYLKSDTDMGNIVIALARNKKLLYRSGPVTTNQTLTVMYDENIKTITMPVLPEWTVLDFSRSTLPDSFVVRISDAGSGYGEWSAIAVKNDELK